MQENKRTRVSINMLKNQTVGVTPQPGKRREDLRNTSNSRLSDVRKMIQLDRNVYMHREP